MRIIGIDPGTAITGFSIMDLKNRELKLIDYGCIRTASGLAQNERLNQIAQDLKTLIKKYKPNHAAIERLFFNKNVTTAISVAQARGVVLQILKENGIDSEEFTPQQIKSAICGNGRADKKMVQEMVRLILKLKETPQPDDAADAIAIAITSLNTHKFA
ncbi:crossover junction endodeoxyribonuclease RuvC [Patescibacteria group bacterium]|nr:crossover junction endodeoxyribonuclease RuvC [Patescibacteria group bacterium]